MLEVVPVAEILTVVFWVVTTCGFVWKVTALYLVYQSSIRGRDREFCLKH